jgi:predicted MFS family arabinose efflux permease
MFAVVTALALLAIVVVALLRLPPPALPEAGTLARSVAVLIAQPVFLTALAASVAGYGVMSIIMSATPLAMQLCGLSRASSSDVIQWHMLGMFAPSLFAGDVLRRIGMVKFLSCGALLMGGAILAALNGQDLAHFYIALTLLGVGWTFLFIGGSTLLAQAWRPGEQAKVQAAHDFVVFGVASCGTFFSGRVLTGRGWSSVNTLTLPLLLLAAVMIVVHWRRTRVATYA